MQLATTALKDLNLILTLFVLLEPTQLPELVNPEIAFLAQLAALAQVEALLLPSVL